MRRYGSRNDTTISAAGIKVAGKPDKRPEEKALGVFYQMRDQLWWMMREWLKNDPGAMLPPDEELIEELMVPTYSTASGKLRVMTKDNMKKLLPGKRSPDRAESLALTFARASVGWAWGMAN